MALPTKWIVKPEADVLKAKELSERLNVDLLIAGLLVQRRVETFDEARKFFRPELSDLHDPFLMADMDKAVERLSQAFFKKERILVYGDYDVDGTTAVTLMYSFLSGLGMDCEFYIPDRYTEGYGFSLKGAEYAAANGFALIVTLDCGIRDVEKIARCNELGVDVIVCDHHMPGDLPPAVAVLDPKRKDCNYPFKELSGCGVGFKLLQAFCMQQGIPEEKLFQYLDLLTISIGADIVSVTDENRVLAFHGLQSDDTSFFRADDYVVLQALDVANDDFSLWILYVVIDEIEGRDPDFITGRHRLAEREPPVLG